MSTSKLLVFEKLHNIRYHHIPVLDSLTAGITREKAADRNVFSRFGAEPDKARRSCDGGSAEVSFMNIIDTWIFLLEIVNFCGKISISVLYSRQIRK